MEEENMVFALPGTSELISFAFAWLYIGVLVVAAVKLIGWFVDRRTRELRQRVALLEHEVAELQESESGNDAVSDDKG